jgi:GNAT superfamily N-acetyltransferase
MQPGDLEATVAAIRDGGWGEQHASLAFFLQHAAAQPFVAESEGAIVGTGVAVQSGLVGWVGLIFTAPAVRGRGLGGLLTQTVVRHLQAAGCRSLLLAATGLGQPVYARLGFLPEPGYTMWSGAALGSGGAPVDARLRRLTPADLPAVCALDREYTREDRGHAIRAMPEGWVVADGAHIAGFALRTPWGLGPAVASDPTDGRLLLDVLRSQTTQQPMRMVIPTENAAAARYLELHGFQPQQTLPRMRLGDPVPWQPHGIWTIFSFAMG